MARQFTKNTANAGSLGLNAIGPLFNGASSISVIAWIYPRTFSLTSNGDNRIFNVVGGTGTGVGVMALSLDGLSSGRVRISSRDKIANAVSNFTSTSNNPVANTWQLVGGIADFANAQLHTIYNSTRETTAASAFNSTTYVHSTSTTNHDRIGHGTNLTSTAQQLDGAMGLVTCWKNYVLTVSDLAKLAAGTHPTLIARQNMVQCWELLRSDTVENGLLPGGPAFTVTAGTIPVDKPPPVQPYTTSLWWPGWHWSPPTGVTTIKLYPNADADIGTWTTQAGGTSNLFQTVDEVSPNDADYVQSEDSPTESVIRFGLSDNGNTTTKTDHILRYRYEKEGTQTISLLVNLKQDDTIIASQMHYNISSTVTAGELALSVAEASNITNYRNLYVEFIADRKFLVPLIGVSSIGAIGNVFQNVLLTPSSLLATSALGQAFVNIVQGGKAKMFARVLPGLGNTAVGVDDVYGVPYNFIRYRIINREVWDANLDGHLDTNFDTTSTFNSNVNNINNGPQQYVVLDWERAVSPFSGTGNMWEDDATGRNGLTRQTSALADGIALINEFKSRCPGKKFGIYFLPKQTSESLWNDPNSNYLGDAPQSMQDFWEVVDFVAPDLYQRLQIRTPVTNSTYQITDATDLNRMTNAANLCLECAEVGSIGGTRTVEVLPFVSDNYIVNSQNPLNNTEIPLEEMYNHVKRFCQTTRNGKRATGVFWWETSDPDFGFDNVTEAEVKAMYQAINLLNYDPTMPRPS